MKTTTNLIFFTILLSVGIGYAQPPAGMRGDGNIESVGIVKGKVLDNTTNDPLPYSNIVLNNQRDSTIVTGAIASEDGSFILEKLPFGMFYLEIKFIGFEKKIIPDVNISSENSSIDLGVVRIIEAAEKLQEVQVTAERSPIEYKIDRKVIRVSENLNTQGESVARALENAPSVTVDMDGNVMVRGSSNFTVLIDGKPSPLEGSDALKQIPASAVENVEIITNPSAKYDPDGLAGIINIVTKKRVLDGFSGIVNASVGINNKYRGDLLLNYKTNKWSFYAGADYNDENRIGNLTRTMVSQSNDTTLYILTDGGGGHEHDGYTIKGGVTYEINAQNSLSLEGSVGQHGRGRSIEDNFYEYTEPSTDDEYYISQNDGGRVKDFYNLTLNYSRIFNSKDHNLTTYLNIEREKGGSEDHQNQWDTDENWNIIDDDPYRIYTQETDKELGIRYQLDYIRPLFENGKVETGYQMRLDMENEEYHFNNWDSDAGEWISNPEYSSAMDFKRNIQAAYGVFSAEWETIGIQAGLRSEYTYRRVDHLLSDVPAIIDRFDFFPSVHISKKIGEKDQILASYSRRINRPRGGWLDPFQILWIPTHYESEILNYNLNM